MTAIKMNLHYKIACIMVTGKDVIIGGIVAKVNDHKHISFTDHKCVVLRQSKYCCRKQLLNISVPLDGTMDFEVTLMSHRT